MSSTVEGTVVRGKAHKGGKVVSLSIIWAGVAIVALLVIWQAVSLLGGKKALQHNRDIVAVTSVTSGDRLQPVSAKIMASDSGSMIMAEDAIDVEDYADVWQKLERLAPVSASEQERTKVIEVFLSGLDYKMTARGGEIVSITTGDPISPVTLACYLNGYIPEKPYLKTNCPSY